MTITLELTTEQERRLELEYWHVIRTKVRSRVAE